MGEPLIVICGVSASGKSTIGRALANRIGYHFVEGDDFHPFSNIEKMTSGIALTDDDRKDWLKNLCQELERTSTEPVVMACSALTPFVQDYLIRHGRKTTQWINLSISVKCAQNRMATREHFMPATLIASQFEAWTPPATGLSVDAERPALNVVDIISAHLNELEIT